MRSAQTDFQLNPTAANILNAGTMSGLGLVCGNLWIEGKPHIENGIDFSEAEIENDDDDVHLKWAAGVHAEESNKYAPTSIRTLGMATSQAAAKLGAVVQPLVSAPFLRNVTH